MRSLVKFNRNENTIDMVVYDKINKRSNHFYILNDEIQSVFDKNDILTKDIYSYCRISKKEDKIYFNIDWLERCGNNKLQGYTQNFTISANKFVQWYESQEVQYVCISLNENKTAKFDVRSEKNLKEILNDKTLRKKFTKGIQRLMCWQGETIELYDDFVDHSFYFVEKDKDNNRVMNGGLIFHKDFDERENIKKGYYQVHT